MAYWYFNVVFRLFVCFVYVYVVFFFFFFKFLKQFASGCSYYYKTVLKLILRQNMLNFGLGHSSPIQEKQTWFSWTKTSLFVSNSPKMYLVVQFFCSAWITYKCGIGQTFVVLIAGLNISWEIIYRIWYSLMKLKTRLVHPSFKYFAILESLNHEFCNLSFLASWHKMFLFSTSIWTNSPACVWLSSISLKMLFCPQWPTLSNIIKRVNAFWGKT